MPGTAYAIRVKAFNEVGWSEVKLTCHCSIQPAPVLTQIQLCHVANAGNISWQPTSDIDAVGYLLRHQLTSDKYSLSFLVR